MIGHCCNFFDPATKAQPTTEPAHTQLLNIINLYKFHTYAAEDHQHQPTHSPLAQTQPAHTQLSHDNQTTQRTLSSHNNATCTMCSAHISPAQTKSAHILSLCLAIDLFT